jgi:hypothetical protein
VAGLVGAGFALAVAASHRAKAGSRTAAGSGRLRVADPDVLDPVTAGAKLLGKGAHGEEKRDHLAHVVQGVVRFGADFRKQVHDPVVRRGGEPAVADVELVTEDQADFPGAAHCWRALLRMPRQRSLQ